MIQFHLLTFILDPIWLIASVEEGGLMGITQQLDQCHSLGMNTNYSHIPPSHNLLYQTSSVNPFQSTRCKLIRLDSNFNDYLS
jgi:hypothetical protein